jgi:hypothetical protein
VRPSPAQPLNKEATVMGLIPKVLSVVLLVGCLVTAVAVAGELECKGPYKDRMLTPEELATVLDNHQAWLGSGRERDDKRRANLCQANLEKARLVRTNLQGASLDGASLQEAELSNINLRGTRLFRVNLQGAILSGANLREASLVEANLQGAALDAAKLQGAHLIQANLKGANLWDAKLQGALLDEANLEEANLFEANLQGVVYEPNPGKLPNFWTLTDPGNHLETLVFHDSPAALIALREAFKKGGMRTQERQLTYAIEHTRRLQAWNPSWHDPREEDPRPWLEKFWGKLESGFKLVAFELPSDYGMSYGRPLKILGVSIGGFSLLYIIALVTARGRAGIWVTWPTDRVYKQEGPAGEGETSPSRVTSTFVFPRLQAWAARRRWRIWSLLLRGLGIPLTGLYFSLLSAFSLGWRELNVGTWIARVQTREYVLRATGWVRMVAGLQSLLSVYLLALWVLTYFGRPFE